jgi:hypothetical protein
LEHIEGLQNLQILRLAGTEVTDAGLKRLEGLTNLRALELSTPGVTEAGVKKVLQALPACAVALVEKERIGVDFSLGLDEADAP